VIGGEARDNLAAADRALFSRHGRFIIGTVDANCLRQGSM
jgi:hypothetical protein